MKNTERMNEKNEIEAKLLFAKGVRFFCYCAGMELYKGFKFLLIALGISGGVALLFWQSPEFLKALAEFILTLKNS